MLFIFKALFFHSQLMISGTKNGNHSLLSTNTNNSTENKFAIPLFKFARHSNINTPISHRRLAHLSHARRLSYITHNRRISNTQRHSIITVQDPEGEA